MNARETVVLLVENDADVELGIAVTLQRSSPPTLLRSVPTGEMAVQYLAGEPPFDDREEYPIPEVIILDLKLPGISGFDLLSWRWMRESLRTVPVLALVEAYDLQGRERALALGANAIQEKPLDYTLIRPIVEELIRAQAVQATGP